MSAVGKGDWLICVEGHTDGLGDAVVSGSLYQITHLNTRPGVCARCGGKEAGVRVHTDKDPRGFWCLTRFRPAGKGGMFNDLLKAEPVKTREDA
ncbi:hypothetical protein [Phenylobacterium sp.]|uniref:hypothetical protein n=1 Tax=Phenylobacterium sp. TaxID=1871053 RepID=UPI002737A4C8|nr:hypothetical protein [Phenylobacterium sp.]MDP3869153.1 hypothetical protein [Phenylobacterium sp.]